MLRPKFNWRKIEKENLWYLVGLISTDGSLSKDGRHIDITAKEQNYLSKIKHLCDLPQFVTSKTNGRGNQSYRIQIGSKDFYQFLISIGLFPDKSRNLGPIQIDVAYFNSFLRGIIDGDGSIRRWNHPTNGIEQWSIRIVSGSPIFLQWLQEKIKECCHVSGKIYENHTNTEWYVLKFGKLEAKVICSYCYTSCENFLYLDRKYRLAETLLSNEVKWKKWGISHNARVVELVDT